MLCLKIPPRNRLLYKKMLGGLPCQKAALCLPENTSPGKTNDSFTTGELPLPLLKLVASITVERRRGRGGFSILSPGVIIGIISLR